MSQYDCDPDFRSAPRFDGDEDNCGYGYSPDKFVTRRTKKRTRAYAIANATNIAAEVAATAAANATTGDDDPLFVTTVATAATKDAVNASVTDAANADANSTIAVDTFGNRTKASTRSSLSGTTRKASEVAQPKCPSPPRKKIKINPMQPNKRGKKETRPTCPSCPRKKKRASHDNTSCNEACTGKRAQPKCPPLRKKKAPSRRVEISPPKRPYLRMNSYVHSQYPSRWLQVPAENDTSPVHISEDEMLFGLDYALLNLDEPNADLIPAASLIKPRKDQHSERKKRRIGGRDQFIIRKDPE